MRSFIVKLAAWHRLHEQREQARLRLAQAGTAASGDRPDELRADLVRIEQAVDEALAELLAAANDRIASQGSGEGARSTVTDRPPS